jgi:hypothetical protein
VPVQQPGFCLAPLETKCVKTQNLGLMPRVFIVGNAATHQQRGMIDTRVLKV